jgi:hypothetical protein
MYLSGDGFAYTTRNKRQVFNAAAVLAVVCAVGPGCASLGYTQSILKIDRSLIQTIAKRRLLGVSSAMKQQLIPTTATANLEGARVVSAALNAVACVREVVVGVELNEVGAESSKLPGLAFLSENFGGTVVKMPVFVDRRENIGILSIVPGAVNSTRAIDAAPSLRQVCAKFCACAGTRQKNQSRRSTRSRPWCSDRSAVR